LATVEGNDTNYRVLIRGEYTHAVLNVAPYSPGHVLIVPHEHTATYHRFDLDTLLECALLQQKTIEPVQESSYPHGVNVGTNLGEAGGASISDHLHVCVVPRWQGDTTFMPVLTDTKQYPKYPKRSTRRMSDYTRPSQHLMIPN
jgi:ATP adenylyltransferase